MKVEPTNDAHRDGGAPGRMAGDHLPLGHVVHDELPVDPLFDADGLVEADIAHQGVKEFVVVPDASCIRSLLAVFLEDPVSRLRVDGVFVDVHHGLVAGLLLDDPEDVPVEAFRLDSDHIRMPLEEVAGKDEHVAHLVHRHSEVCPAVSVEAVDIKVGNTGDFVSAQGDLLVLAFGQLDVAVCRRHRDVVFGRPGEDGFEVVAHRRDGGSFQASVLAEPDEIAPEHIGHLDWLQGGAIFRLEQPDVVQQSADGLVVRLVKLGSCLCTGEDYFDERTVFKVEGERVSQGLFKVGLEVIQRLLLTSIKLF